MIHRIERIASTMQQELAQIIQFELSDPRLVGMPSITRIKVAPDLSSADIYVTIMGSPGQQTAALNALKHSAGIMRTKLTKAMTLRHTPFLRFHMDDNLKKELEVLNLLRKVEEENAMLDARRAAERGETAPADAGDAVAADDSSADAGDTAGTKDEPRADEAGGDAGGRPGPSNGAGEDDTNGGQSR